MMWLILDSGYHINLMVNMNWLARWDMLKVLSIAWMFEVMYIWTSERKADVGHMPYILALD